MVSSNPTHDSLEAGRTPRVSIGLPVYNGAAWLTETVDSLLAQTYRDFELIISDNASTDETRAICERYAASDPRIRYFREPVNRGLCWNWNRVFELSRGEYFKWSACDDLYDRTFLESVVAILDQRPDVAWCHSVSRHIDSHGQPIPDETTPEISHVNLTNGSLRGCCRTSERASERFKAVLLGHNGLDCYGVIRSALVRQTLLLLPYFGAEKILTAELALRGRYFEVPETLFFARIHEEAAGNLHSTSEQRQLMNPADKKWRSQRFALLSGYFKAIHRAHLPLIERMRCYVAVMRYLLQISKWKSVFKKAISGAGVANGYPSLAQNGSKANS